MTSDALVTKRFGEYLVELQVLRPEWVEEALIRQKRMHETGMHATIGAILRGMGAIDHESLEAIAVRQALDNGTIDLGAMGDWSPYRRPRTAAKEPERHAGPGLSSQAAPRPQASSRARRKRKTRGRNQPRGKAR